MQGHVPGTPRGGTAGPGFRASVAVSGTNKGSGTSISLRTPPFWSLNTCLCLGCYIQGSIHLKLFECVAAAGVRDR